METKNQQATNEHEIPICSHCGQRGQYLGICQMDLDMVCTECGEKKGDNVQHKESWCWNPETPMFKGRE